MIFSLIALMTLLTSKVREHLMKFSEIAWMTVLISNLLNFMKLFMNDCLKKAKRRIRVFSVVVNPARYVPKKFASPTRLSVQRRCQGSLQSII